jgi:hypothetical protein
MHITREGTKHFLPPFIYVTKPGGCGSWGSAKGRIRKNHWVVATGPRFERMLNALDLAC